MRVKGQVDELRVETIEVVRVIECNKLRIAELLVAIGIGWNFLFLTNEYVEFATRFPYLNRTWGILAETIQLVDLPCSYFLTSFWHKNSCSHVEKWIAHKLKTVLCLVKLMVKILKRNAFFRLTREIFLIQLRHELIV
jgi:hypothetical protein